MTGRPAVGPPPITDPAHTTIPHELSHSEILELVECADIAVVEARVE